MEERETEIRELCELAGMSTAYADHCVSLGTRAAQVRCDLFKAAAKDPRHSLGGVIPEQVKR